MIIPNVLKDSFKETLIDFSIPFVLIEHIQSVSNLLLTEWDDYNHLSVSVGVSKLYLKFVENEKIGGKELQYYIDPRDFGFTDAKEFFDKFHCIKTYLEIME